MPPEKQEDTRMKRSEIISSCKGLLKELKTETDPKRITFLKATLNRYYKMLGRKQPFTW